MPVLAASPELSVREAPAAEAERYVRELYAELTTDADAVPVGEMEFSDCRWFPCAIDGRCCGGFLVVGTESGNPQVHTLLQPPARGRLAVALARQALALYRHLGGCKLLACCYSDNRAAQLFITACGFRRLQSLDEGETRRGSSVRAIYYESEETNHG